MDIIDELTEIRQELLTGAENLDVLYVRMQINRLDTVIYNLNKGCKEGTTKGSLGGSASD